MRLAASAFLRACGLAVGDSSIAMALELAAEVARTATRVARSTCLLHTQDVSASPVIAAYGRSLASAAVGPVVAGASLPSAIRLLEVAAAIASGI